ncbi:hypothetical protein GCM10027176_81190 [Actinoallomurus bryophytorum]|uniref:Uncharacterized protein n=1 Tax=Actinoallomurus bryophytorum TaxID=1490222 RepID=A0A543CI20_9ACTN|nr:hypothetical protein FB559_2286 [Actinoallomurus bryophytorum]
MAERLGEERQTPQDDLNAEGAARRTDQDQLHRGPPAEPAHQAARRSVRHVVVAARESANTTPIATVMAPPAATL